MGLKGKKEVIKEVLKKYQAYGSGSEKAAINIYKKGSFKTSI